MLDSPETALIAESSGRYRRTKQEERFRHGNELYIFYRKLDGSKIIIRNQWFVRYTFFFPLTGPNENDIAVYKKTRLIMMDVYDIWPTMMGCIYCVLIAQSFSTQRE